MSSLSTRTTLLLNWYANPYHTPIFVAQSLGFFEEEGIKLAILEPSDPSDVTEIVGLGKVDFGVKAMIHTIAARAKGYPVCSIGTLLDEPPTGLIALKSKIQTFQDIQGNRVGYIGEFGKKIIDNLAMLAGIDPNSYKTVRVGMNMTDAIVQDKVDAGIGFLNFQKVELESLLGEETTFLRIDQLAGLGCCCFCSIQFIVHENQLKDEAKVKGFLKAILRGTRITIENPEKAYALLCQAKPNLRTDLYKTIFYRTLPFFSRDILNVERDWNTVASFSRHLNLIDSHFDIKNCYSNSHVITRAPADIAPIACCLE